MANISSINGNPIVVDANGIVDNSIGDSKLVKSGGVLSATEENGISLRELRHETNIFTSENITYGKYLNTSGNEVSDAQYAVSDYIPIHGGAKYTLRAYLNKYGSNGVRTQNFYTEDYARIAANGTYDSNTESVTVTAPESAAYMRVTVRVSEIESFMLVKGDSYPSVYLPYGKVVLKDDVVYNVPFIKKDSFVNLYDPDSPDILVGQKIEYSGNISSNSALAVSGFIPCTDGDVLTFPIYTNHFGTGSAATYVAAYNADKTWIRSIAGVRNGSFLTVTIPARVMVKYIRVNVGVNDQNSIYIITPYHSKSNFMVVKGSEFPVERFYPFDALEIADGNIYSEHEDKSNPLYRKSVVFLGDSICEGDSLSGWAGRIGRKNLMFWVNSGIGGSTISTALATKCICTRAITIDKPEYIILEGGTNDADRIGSVIGGTTPEKFGAFDANDYGNDELDYYGFDISTYCGALDYLFRRIVTEYAGAKVGFVIAHKMGVASSYLPESNNRRAYFEQAIKSCEKWGIPYLNLWDGCYLNPKNPSLYVSGDEDSYYLDGQHLRAKGYDYISPIIESWMKTL